MAEQAGSKLRINLRVYDEDIEVTINRQDEQLYRAAAKLITQRYETYAQIYHNHKSDHTIALMTMVDIALRHQRQLQAHDTEPIARVLTALNATMAKALSDTQ